MKAFLFCLVTTCSPAFAQTAPVKRANQIAVQVVDSGAIAWKRTAQILAARGYGIKASDKDLLSLTTEPKHVRRVGNITLSVLVKGQTVLLSGNFTVGAISTEVERITYRGMEGSPFMVAWKELEGVSSELGGTVSYKLMP